MSRTGESPAKRSARAYSSAPGRPVVIASATVVTNTAHAAWQTGSGWLSRLSPAASRASASLGSDAPKIPSGLDRISEPLAWVFWLARCRMRSASPGPGTSPRPKAWSVAMPQSKGSDFRQRA